MNGADYLTVAASALAALGWIVARRMKHQRDETRILLTRALDAGAQAAQIGLAQAAASRATTPIFENLKRERDEFVEAAKRDMDRIARGEL